MRATSGTPITRLLLPVAPPHQPNRQKSPPTTMSRMAQMFHHANRVAR